MPGTLHGVFPVPVICTEAFILIIMTIMPGYNSCVNFLTCHDGFTMYDLYSYNEKHNEANGWNNTDGSNDNRSWN